MLLYLNELLWVLRSYLCKVLLRDAAGPLDAELQRPAGVRHIRTLDQHSLYQQAVLWRVPDVGLAISVAVQTLSASAHKHLNLIQQ